MVCVVHAKPTPPEILLCTRLFICIPCCEALFKETFYFPWNCSSLSYKLFPKAPGMLLTLMTFFLFLAMILCLTRFSPLSTGFFFLLSWSFFTYQHREEISQDFSCLGSSYWLGALGWFLLLVVEIIVFIAEQAVVPDIIPDLEKAVETWRISSQLKAAKCSGSESLYSGYSNMAPERATLVS